MANRYGTLGADSLVGTATGDYISGGPLGNEAADTGNDTLIGGGGNDRIYGWGGNDSLRAAYEGVFFGAQLFGGTGNDSIDAGDASYGYGEAGNDTIIGGGIDANIWAQLEGGQGNDVLIATGTGDNYLFGGDDADTITGSAGNNYITDDTGIGDAYNFDADRMAAGAGNDAIESYGGADTVDGGDGVDRLDLYLGDYTTTIAFKASATGAASITTGGSIASIETFVIYTGSGRDRITTLAGNDFIDAGDGNDLLNGAGGDDFLAGGNGNDTLIGGGGRDRLSDSNGADTFRYLALAGRDSIEGFSKTDDILEFSSAAVGGLLPLGGLDAASFALNAATKAGPQFVFNTRTKVLSWDADGTGSGIAVQVAAFTTFTPATNLDASDIVIIA